MSLTTPLWESSADLLKNTGRKWELKIKFIIKHTHRCHRRKRIGLASLYIGYADKEIVTGFDKFGELFKKAVDETEKSVSNDSTSNRGSGGGGGGFKGGETSVKEKPDATNSDNTKNDDNGVFADISNVSWAKDAILSLAQKGIINGTAPKTFEPNSNVTGADQRYFPGGFNLSNT